MSKTVAELLVQIGSKTTGMDAGLTNASTKLNKFAAAAKNAFQVVAGGMIVKKLFEIGKGAADAADKMAKLSARTNTPVEGLYAVQIAVNRMGLSFEGVEKGALKLNKTIGQTLHNEAKMAEMQALGLDPVKLALSGMDEQLVQVSQALSKYSTYAEKAGYASMLFGRSGAEMTRVFSDGGKAIKDAQEYMSRFGFDFDYEEIEDMNDRIMEAKTSMSLLANAALVEVAPAFQFWAEGVASVVVELSKLGGRLDQNGKELGFWGTALNSWQQTYNDLLRSLEGGIPIAEAQDRSNLVTYTHVVNKLQDSLQSGAITLEEYKSRVVALRKEFDALKGTGEIFKPVLGLPSTKQQSAESIAQKRMMEELELEEKARIDRLMDDSDKLLDKWQDVVVKYGNLGNQLDQMREMGLIDEATYAQEFAEISKELNDALNKQFEIDPSVLAQWEGAFNAIITEQQKMADAQQQAVESYFANIQAFAGGEFDATRTPFEKYEEHIMKLNEALFWGALSWDTYWRSAGNAATKLDEALGLDNMQPLGDMMGGMFEPGMSMSTSVSAPQAPGTAGSFSPTQIAGVLLGLNVADTAKQQLAEARKATGLLEHIAYSPGGIRL